MNKTIDIHDLDFTRFNHQVEKTQTAGKLLNYYGDLILRIEYAIKSESVIKDIPKRVADVPVFKNLIYNKVYTNIFNIKLNNVHKLAEEFEKGIVYLEKLTMSNRSKWLKKHFKNEIKNFSSTYKEVVIKSYFDLKDRAQPIKYDVIFNFSGVNPNNQQKFQEINQLTRFAVAEKDVMEMIQRFIDATDSQDIKLISKEQLLDLIEESMQEQGLIGEEFLGKLNLGRDDDVEIYKNPKTIKKFEPNVRALSDEEGNLFVADRDVYIIHDTIYHWLISNGFVTRFSSNATGQGFYNFTWAGKKMAMWQRDRDTMAFKLAESYVRLNQPEVMKNLQELAEKAHQKNPQYQFILERIN